MYYLTLKKFGWYMHYTHNACPIILIVPINNNSDTTIYDIINNSIDRSVTFYYNIRTLVEIPSHDLVIINNIRIYSDIVCIIYLDTP